MQQSWQKSAANDTVLQQFVRYTLVGAGNTAVELGSLNLLLLLFASRAASSITLFSTIAYALSMLNGYLGHRRWTFSGARRHRGVMRYFVILNLLTLGLNAAIVLLLTLNLPLVVALDPMLLANISKGLASVLCGCVNFLGNRVWVFQVARAGELPKELHVSGACR